MSGIFQYDEKQECDELFSYAKMFDESSECNLALAVLAFISECATKITTELKSYIDNLKKGQYDFSKISKHTDIGDKIRVLCQTSNLQSIDALIRCIENSDVFKIYRKELYVEMLRSIKYASEKRMSIVEAANHIRKDAHLQRNYNNFKYLSTRTLLSKGLEFDCVIIDTKDKLSAKEFYVAMTRAKKKIFIISDTRNFTFTNS